MENIETRHISLTAKELSEIMEFKGECELTLDYFADGLSYPPQENSTHLRKVAGKIFKTLLLDNCSDDIENVSKQINYGNTSAMKAMCICSKYLTKVTHYLVRNMEDADLLLIYEINKKHDSDSFIITYTVKKAVE